MTHTTGQAGDRVTPRSRSVVPYQRPWLPPADAVVEHYRRSEQAGMYANRGPCARLLEQRIAERLGGAVECVSFASCTVAITTALSALLGPSVPPRRLVATPAYTFTATACAIVAAGYEPLFVDVEPEGWQLDARSLEEVLAEHGDDVAAVLACSTLGTPARPELVDAWAAIASAAGVPLLLDSAAAFGGEDAAGRPAGGRGVPELFSFHATKPFAIGEGGLLTTTDARLADDARRLQNFGLDPVSRVSVAPGVNGKLSELAAATGLAMLDAFDVQMAARRANVAALREQIDGAEVAWQQGAEGSTWQVVPVVLRDATARDAVLRRAAADRVEVRAPFDPPLHRHPAFATAARGALPVSEDLAARTVALPMANDLDDDELARIAAVVLGG